MAVERLTDYTRRIWTALGPDDPTGHDIQVGDVIYFMDSSECAIVTNVYPDGSIDAETLPDIGGGGGGGGGGNTFVITEYTIPRNETINVAINAANIPLVWQNEVLIWNIKGTHQQGSGSVSGKMGIAVVQGGVLIGNACGYKQATAVAAPDDMVPRNAWVNGAAPVQSIVDGHYYAGTGNNFNVGGGNTIEFIQIPYNMGWATA